ncbi:alpha-protein kinase 1 isoform X2 [Narcine bancroftii]|uniref:alpha-protein kinase 1 isoform X2 n=1 Tax=Narcine bancroftii TaxID=1343680 RepID=UPI003831B0FB
MNNQEVISLLQECKQALDAPPSEPSEENKTEYWQCEASLSVDLRTLLKQAKEMKWPFVPERWQYKQEVRPEDKTNLKDIISEELPDLLVFLKASVSVGDYASAAATVFLIDRFLYWVDASSKLLQVAKGLHKRCMEIPIAPQVVVRQARVSVNSGKLLKAEYILSSLINNCGASGTWVYEKKSDCTLVQSVSIQIRGQILQKLGLWYEAAELIWASIVGFYELPHPDKKGISTSLGILADLLVSMSDEDYNRFKKDPQMDLILVEEFTDRLLSAAEAGKLAAVFSQYNPLYVLTNLNIFGTCLLSYSFKGKSSKEESQFYLLQAKEAFEVGLLTKRDGDIITSKQELHGFVKAAFSLTTVHKWFSGNSESLMKMRQLCKEAMEKLYLYSTQNQDTLAQEIMELISQVKTSLQIKDLCKSDHKSYVPDHYKHYWDKPIVKGRMTFNKILERHKQYHRTICTVFDGSCRRQQNSSGISGYSCITAFKTETKELDTADANASIPHHTDSYIPQNSLSKEAEAMQNNQELQNRINVNKSANQCADPLKGSKACHAISGNYQPHIATGAKNYQPHVATGTDKTSDEASSDGKGYTDHLSDSHGSSSSSNSWLRASGPGVSGSWEKVIISEGSRECPRNGSKPHLFFVDTECSTFLTDEVREHQQTDQNAENEDCNFSNNIARPVSPSAYQLSEMYEQFRDSSISCTRGDKRKTIPSSLSSEHESFKMTGPDRKTLEDYILGSYIESSKYDQPCQTTCQTSATHSGSVDFSRVNNSSSVDSGSFEMLDSDADTGDDNVEDNKINRYLGSPGHAPHSHSASDPTCKTSKTHSDSRNFRKITSSSSGESNSFEMIDTDAETADNIQDDMNEFPMSGNKNNLAKTCYPQPWSKAAKPVIIDSNNSGNLTKGSQSFLGKNESHKMLLVDATADGTEENYYFPTPLGIAEESKKQEMHSHDTMQMRNCSAKSLLPIKEPDKGWCKMIPVEGENEDDILSNQPLNSSLNSSSSLRSWCKSLFSSSGSDLDYINSSLSSSSSSFVFLSKKKQTFKRRVITDEDYKMFFAGVTHEWLIERLKGTGVFYPHRLKDTCNMLENNTKKQKSSPIISMTLSGK